MTARPAQLAAARALVLMSRRATLATLDAEGAPYASLVEVLPLPGGDVVMLLSTLAEHTTNLTADARASLLITEPWPSDEPLERPRVTLMGDITRLAPDEAPRDAFIEAHPGAAMYVDFKDFAFYRLHVTRARYIAGFGRMGWQDEAAWSSAEPDLMWSAAPGVIAHMNDDHAHNLLDYAHALCALPWAERALMVGLDQHGFDMVVHGRDGDTPRREAVRYTFDAPITDPRHVRKIFVQLAHAARAAEGDA